MSVTTTKTETIQSALDDANPNKVADALQRVALGTLVTPLKRVFTGLTSLAAQDLTAIDGTGETTGPTNPKRLALLAGGTLRVTAGAAAAGARFLTDTGGTPSATVATISDDGKTVTFEAAVTAFVIEYIPRPHTVMSTKFAPTS